MSEEERERTQEDPSSGSLKRNRSEALQQESLETGGLEPEPKRHKTHDSPSAPPTEEQEAPKVCSPPATPATPAVPAPPAPPAVSKKSAGSTNTATGPTSGGPQINFGALLSFARYSSGYFPLLEALKNVNNGPSSSSSTSSSSPPSSSLSSSSIREENVWPSQWQRENSAPMMQISKDMKIVSNPTGYKTARSSFPALPPLPSISSPNTIPLPVHWYFEIDVLNPVDSADDESSDQTQNGTSISNHQHQDGDQQQQQQHQQRSERGKKGLPVIGEGAHVRIGWSSASNDLQGPVGFNEFGFGWRDNPPTLFFMGRPVIPGSSLTSLLLSHREKNSSSSSIPFAKVGNASAPPLSSYASSLPTYGEPWGVGDTIGCLLTLTTPSPLASPSPSLTPTLITLPPEKEGGKEGELEIEMMEKSVVRFFKNGRDMGIAFTDIPCVGSSRSKAFEREGRGGEWYPSVSLYYGGRVRLNCGPLFRFPISPSSSPSPSPLSSSIMLTEGSSKAEESIQRLFKVSPFAHPMCDAAPKYVIPDPPPFPPDLFAQLRAAALEPSSFFAPS